MQMASIEEELNQTAAVVTTADADLSAKISARDVAIESSVNAQNAWVEETTVVASLTSDLNGFEGAAAERRAAVDRAQATHATAQDISHKFAELRRGPSADVPPCD